MSRKRDKERYWRKKMAEAEREMLAFYRVSEEGLRQSDGSFFFHCFKLGKRIATRELAANVLRAQSSRL